MYQIVSFVLLLSKYNLCLVFTLMFYSIPGFWWSQQRWRKRGGVALGAAVMVTSVQCRKMQQAIQSNLLALNLSLFNIHLFLLSVAGRSSITTACRWSAVELSAKLRHVKCISSCSKILVCYLLNFFSMIEEISLLLKQLLILDFQKHPWRGICCYKKHPCFQNKLSENW